MVIDLGDELAGYDGEKPSGKRQFKDGGYTLSDLEKLRAGERWQGDNWGANNLAPPPTSLGRVKDLEQQGFNREPPFFPMFNEPPGPNVSLGFAEPSGTPGQFNYTTEGYYAANAVFPGSPAGYWKQEGSSFICSYSPPTQGDSDDSTTSGPAQDPA
jgi:hypothetical protein